MTLVQWTSVSDNNEFIAIISDDDLVITLNNSEECQHASGARFLVSSRQLRSVSSYFEDLFTPELSAEICIGDDGRYHHKVLDFSLAAMSFVMNIAHLQTHMVPRNVTLETFISIITCCTDLSVDIELQPYNNIWVPQLNKLVRSYQYGVEGMRWLLFAYLRDDWYMFRTSAVAMMTKSPVEIDFHGLPFLPDTKEKLNKQRSKAIRALLKATRMLMTRLTAGLEGCSEFCNALMLGSLSRGLQRAGILHRVLHHSDAPEGVSYERLTELIEYIEVPRMSDEAAPYVCESCRLVYLLDPIIVKAQNCLVIKRKDFGWEA
ncbi:hypothetical protein HBH70_072690 [Parastagonospora nodorum]|nr:hypothetical protein HBH53_183170 [Parastagonospora nodorum]KAH3964200.1 hypothetical protein HBH51_162660 [Parastagonospora nodorum]KAH4053462.1 hypothetical protein HBH49_084010 [Parastagonospora nodorum]KAH4067412.1 hypothetical protein HBH50_139890 [Parastagonospora nodorum]KAH4077721.1 hypothetical protein HBH48_238760 [Parastagonospora nodorum]